MRFGRGFGPARFVWRRSVPSDPLPPVPPIRLQADRIAPDPAPQGGRDLAVVVPRSGGRGFGVQQRPVRRRPRGRARSGLPRSTYCVGPRGDGGLKPVLRRLVAVRAGPGGKRGLKAALHLHSVRRQRCPQGGLQPTPPLTTGAPAPRSPPRGPSRGRPPANTTRRRTAACPPRRRSSRSRRRSRPPRARQARRSAPAAPGRPT